MILAQLEAQAKASNRRPWRDRSTCQPRFVRDRLRRRKREQSQGNRIL